MNYVVTAHPADAVSHALVGNFISEDELDLIVSKGSRLVIYSVGPEGLQPFKEVPMYGRIATMQLWRPPGQQLAQLFLSTESNKFCILAWDGSEIVTKANGDLSDRIGRPADSGPIAIMEPRCRLIGLHLYDGLFKVIQANPSGALDGEAFNIRLEELRVIDIKFLHNYQKPTLALLYQDNKDARHLKTYEVNLRDKSFGEGPWSQTNVEAGASMLISVPLGQGVLVLGEHTITYHSGSDFKSIPINFACFKAVGQIDANGSRWLLGDHQGLLYALVLTHSNGVVTALALEKLGQTSQASTLSYLDNGVVFVGSSFGDSQLVRLLTEPEEGSYVKEVERYSNLGPIVDFVVVDLERQGQGQVVTCSGAFKDGSLRIVRNGIGINDQASLALQGIKGIWALRSGGAHATHMVLSFISETRVLAMVEDELGEVELPGFDADAATVYCSNLGEAHVLQATASALRLVAVEGMSLLHEWRAPDGHQISMACVDAEHVLLATTGKQLFLFQLHKGEGGAGARLLEVATATMAQDIACVALWSHFASLEKGQDPSRMDDGSGAASSTCLAAVGLWTDLSVRLLMVPTLAELTLEPLGVDVVPRSLLFATLEARDYLLCALGDGRLMSFCVTPPAEEGSQPRLGERKVVSLGTQPVSLTRFWSKGAPHVFACSDRPAVVHSANQKLLYSNVNVKEVTHMAPFHSEAFPECLAIASEEGLVIGTIDDIQKLHIRTVPLGEQPRRLCHVESARVFALLTAHMGTNPDDGEDVESGHVRLLDDQTLERCDSYSLQPQEAALSILTLAFAGEAADATFVAVGTAFARPDEPEPTSGRLLIFSVTERTLELRHELSTAGAVYALEAFNGKLLAGVNNKLQLYEWMPCARAPRLQLRHEHCGHILVLYVQSRGDFILVGDLMKSVSLLQCTEASGELKELSRDFNANWMTAVSFLDDDTFLGAENWYNLFTTRKNADATTDEDRQRLEVVGEFHLGEFVNRFRKGSLSMHVPESGVAQIPTLLFGTVNGVLGVVASLPQEEFNFFNKLQDKLRGSPGKPGVIKGVGGLLHSEWRSFQNDRKTVAAHNFVDGDLIEAFLELPADKMQTVADDMAVSVEELSKRVRDLERLH